MSFFFMLELLFRQLVSTGFPIALIFAMSRFKCSQRLVWSFWGGIMLFNSCLNVFLIVNFGVLQMRKVFAIFLLIPCLIFLFAASKDKISQIFFSFFTAINVLYFSSILSHLLLGYGLNPGDDKVWEDALVRAAIFGIILVLCQRYVRRPYQFLADNFDTSWRIIAFVPFLFFVLVMVTGLFWGAPSSSTLFCVIFIYIILFYVYVLIYHVFRKTYDLLNQKNANLQLLTQVRALEQQADIFTRSEQQLQILRHDMRHYVSEINILLSHGETGAALEVADRLEKFSSEIISRKFCKNTIINAVITLFIQRAQEAGITVTCECSIPQALPVDSAEYATVIANALENAIHACQNLPDGEPRNIFISCIADPQLILEIRNPYKEKIIFDHLHYPVAQEAGHGTGTQSIRAFAEKYHAAVDYAARDGIFCFRMLLNSH